MKGDRKIVVLDLETTGLDVEKHDVFEIGWAFGGPSGYGKPDSILVPHSWLHAEAEAMRITRYHERGLFPDSASNNWWKREMELATQMQGATILGANPRFDMDRLRRRWRGLEPWHHRPIDVESVAMGVLGLDFPLGLFDLANIVRREGYTVHEPDHTAAQDVRTTIDVYQGLVDMRRRLGQGTLQIT